MQQYGRHWPESLYHVSTDSGSVMFKKQIACSIFIYVAPSYTINNSTIDYIALLTSYICIYGLWLHCCNWAL